MALIDKISNQVSTHMPLARHDGGLGGSGDALRFLLTCLLRGMTSVRSVEKPIPKFLLTCLLRGMTLKNFQHLYGLQSFYSHASCEA